MRFERRLLAILFCVCASIAMAQPAEEIPAPIPQDNGVGDPPLLDIPELVVAPGEEEPPALPAPTVESGGLPQGTADDLSAIPDASGDAAVSAAEPEQGSRHRTDSNIR